MSPARRRSPDPFGLQAFLDSAGVARRIVIYEPSATLFSQGQPSDSVFYIKKGRVKLSVLSTAGREATIAMLRPGDFCGEGGLADQPVRLATATALAPTTALAIDTHEMGRTLRAEHELSDRFIAYMLDRNLRAEAALIDQLFNSSEKRLARVLLLLARYGTQAPPHKKLAKISQARLADMVGITRGRVNGFLTKFKRLGFIADTGAGITINPSLLGVVLSD